MLFQQRAIPYLSQTFNAATAPASVPTSAFKSVHRSIADHKCCCCSSTYWLSQTSGIVPAPALVAVPSTIIKASVVSAAGMVPFMDLPSAANAPVYVAMPSVYTRSSKLSRWLVFASWQKIVATKFSQDNYCRKLAEICYQSTMHVIVLRYKLSIDNASREWSRSIMHDQNSFNEWCMLVMLSIYGACSACSRYYALHEHWLHNPAFGVTKHQSMHVTHV